MIEVGISAAGKHSYHDLGQCIASRNTGSPERKTVTKTVPHMSGFYDFSALYGAAAYESREVTYTFTLLGESREDLQYQKSDLMAWLSTISDDDIWDDDIIGFHFHGSLSGMSWEEAEDGESGTLEVTFLCQPFLIADAPTVVHLAVGENEVYNLWQVANATARAESGTASLTLDGIRQTVGTEETRLVQMVKPGANIVTVEGSPAVLTYTERKV